MYELTALFAYKLIFMAELAATFMFYAARLKKRANFAWRCVGALALCMGAAAAFPVAAYGALYSSFMFLCLFAVAVGAFCLCYNESFVNLLFCGISAYTTRHLAFQMFSIVYAGGSVLSSAILDDRNENVMFNLYGNQSLESGVFSRESVFWATIYLAVYISVYAVVLALFGKKFWAAKDFRIKNNSLFALSGPVLFADIFLHAVLVNITENYNPLYTVLMYVYNILSCIFIFYLQSSLVDMKKIKQDLFVVSALLRQEREQYERTKENIELINLKCHDMKHQISRSVAAKGEYVKDITDLINIYDTSVKTGNEDLDVILTEKSLKCHREQITFTCIADGAKLEFMDVTDIYGLFGNLIDNAMEAVQKLADESRKIIELHVHMQMNMLAVNLQNCYDGEIAFGKNGLPETTKDNKEYHGLGMKSVQMIVDKYDGDMALSANNGVFNVKILLSVPQSN